MDLTPHPEKPAETQPASWGGPPQPPPRPPKQTARDLLPDDPGRRIWLWDYVEVKELAEQLGLKPFRVVADLMELRIFRHTDEIVDFAAAARIAHKHGFVAEKVS
jgi:translation initiation factor IF-2